eukprot:gene6152-4431_t
MSQIGAKIPWRLWFRVHGKAIAQAIPLSFLIVAEARDMYYRASWQVHSIPMEQFATGDVVAICNRWYTMPTWNHVLYSLMSKVLLKSSWDDIAVVSDVSGSPKILFCDFSGAREMPLEEFIQQRRPRGMALRHLVVDKPSPTLHPGVASLFKEEVTKLQARPWYLFNASWRTGHENNYYNFCVQMNQQRVRIKNMISRGQSREAVGVQQRKLQDMEVMRGHLLKFTSNATAFYLFNGSLVSSFLAAYGLVDREQPPPSRYVPQDFAHTIPFIGATQLEEPLVFFRL